MLLSTITSAKCGHRQGAKAVEKYANVEAFRNQENDFNLKSPLVDTFEEEVRSTSNAVQGISTARSGACRKLGSKWLLCSRRLSDDRKKGKRSGTEGGDRAKGNFCLCNGRRPM
jgi:hypothetical protein